ncbi:hypothetical protein [Magnetospirillum molischianum]|uniref:Uncharacterized protein n=1 Tax=Magnetospirillum molischianum DSM 120 TaxID=1150626 RepID=H8FXU4_MAGML|nr:hypothetical protein [Magnetospirillum molischianum]CCG43182.1 hypothetical protein PHAMO_60004 [Magnetospirillum molischianum DSM 120]
MNLTYDKTRNRFYDEHRSISGDYKGFRIFRIGDYLLRELMKIEKNGSLTNPPLDLTGSYTSDFHAMRAIDIYVNDGK